jgi:ribosomal protein S18 acetylase RimI-like enzyme
MVIVRAASAGQITAAAALFDHMLPDDAVARFMADQRHHMLLAIENDEAVGFVSGVEMTHPDKGTEMFLYELAVAKDARNRGIGRALVGALGELARSRGCYGMWVLTDDGNPAALRAYAAAGGTREAPDAVLFTWEFGKA